MAKIITDSSYGIDLDFAHVSVIPKVVKYKTDNTLYLDNFNNMNQDKQIESIDLDDSKIYEALVSAYESGEKDLLLLVPASSSYRLYELAYFRFKSSYLANIQIYSSKLSHITFATMLKDIDEIMNMKMSLFEITNYIKENEDRYESIILIDKTDDIKMNNKAKSLINQCDTKDILLEHTNEGYKVIKSQETSDAQIRSMFLTLKEKNISNNSILIGFNNRFLYADHLGEMIYEELGYENITVSECNEEIRDKYGKNAITLSFRR